MSAEEKIITVPDDDDGQRLDRWLKKHMPFGLAQKLIRKGAIRVNGKKVKQDTKLEAGQEVRLPPFEASEDRPKKKGVNAEDAAFIRSLVIYKDEDVIVLNKPHGLAVQGGTNIKKHVDGMLDAFITRKGVRPRIVHRLDKDTSGVLILARSAEAARELGKLFKGRDVKKIYWAVTVPAPEQNDGTVNAPLIKAGGGQKERIVIDDKEGKKAFTDFVVLERAAKQAAFVAFWPRTGRTHQIRVHAADILGCPVLGDGKYGGEAAYLDGPGISRRLHLHARRMVLPHPVKKGTILDVSAPLPDDLLTSWHALGFDENLKEDPFA